MSHDDTNPARIAALTAVDVAQHAKPCPACNEPIKYNDEIWHNGGGPPPSDAVQCSWCGCRGPHGHGSQRGDYLGSIKDAIRLWNEMPRREA